MPAAPAVEPAPMLAASRVLKRRPGPRFRPATKKSLVPRRRRLIHSPSSTWIAAYARTSVSRDIEWEKRTTLFFGESHAPHSRRHRHGRSPCPVAVDAGSGRTDSGTGSGVEAD